MNRALTLILVACLAFSTVAFNAAADETKNIPDNAAATGVHDSLVAALAHANLTETLQGDGPFTVFAPTDEAFAAAGINLDDFDNDEANATLADILLYHVVAAAVDAANVTDGMVATMANGDNATFTVDNGTVMINDANVTTADVNASNGIIHVIDKVLMPPADESVEEESAEETEEQPVEEVEEVVDPFEGITCTVTVGIGTSGYAYSQTVVNIQPGETVCWFWEDADMPHNVKEVSGFKSSTYVAGGITSGAAASDVAFHHTFTENTTFYYACQPHIAMDMFGEVVVGDGGQTTTTSDSSESEDTPGFMIVPTILAMIGALALISRYDADN